MAGWQAPKVIPWSFAWPTRAVVARSMAVHPQVHDISGGRWSGYSQVGVNRVPVGHRSPDLAGLLLHTPHPCPPAATLRAVDGFSRSSTSLWSPGIPPPMQHRIDERLDCIHCVPVVPSVARVPLPVPW